MHRARLSQRLSWCAAVCLVVVCAAWGAIAQSHPSEYDVKAAYLYNFAKFVKWPSDSKAARNSSFTICVLGNDPFGGALETTVSGEKIDGKPAAVKRIAGVRDASTCNILYIAPSERWRVGEILSTLNRDSTLTVSDIPEFTDRGGMIGFVLDSGRVRFKINLSAAQEARLNLSSELLKVAANVKNR